MPGQYPAHAAARVWPVSGKAGDEVDMQVGYGLPCCRAIIDADIEAVGLEFIGESGLGLVEQGQQVMPLFRRGHEK